MARNNPTTQVLITSGNQAVLPAGQEISTLGVGQVGVFSTSTNQSVDGNTLSLTREFFLAVGINDGAGGTAMVDIKQSAGQYIQSRLITNVAGRCYTPARNKVDYITDFAVKCDTDYMIRVSLANQTVYSQFGFTNAAKVFSAHSNCCADKCTPCADGDGNDVAKQLVTAINNDPDKVVTAEFVDYTTTPGTPVIVPVSGYAAWVADSANAGDTLGIAITYLAEKIYAYAEINLHYDNPRGTYGEIALIEGFECNGKVTPAVEMVYEQGAGYDLQQKEYYHSGHNGGGNYRQSTLNGFAMNVSAPKATTAGKYYTLALTYDFESVGGWEEYKNNLLTIIGIPCGETTTIASFLAVMDKIYAGRFDAQAGDANACPSCTTVNVTSARTLATDGIA